MVLGLVTLALFMTDDQFAYCSAFGMGVAAVVIPLIFLSWFFRNYWLQLAVSAGVVVLLSFYIVYDIHLIMVKLDYDQYVIGALLLYVDIV